MCFWQYSYEENDLGFSEVEVSAEMCDIDFVSAVYSPVVNDEQVILIGCNDGSLAAFDLNKVEFLENAMRTMLTKGQIGHISIKNN